MCFILCVEWDAVGDECIEICTGICLKLLLPKLLVEDINLVNRKIFKEPFTSVDSFNCPALHRIFLNMAFCGNEFAIITICSVRCFSTPVQAPSEIVLNWFSIGQS